MVSIYVARICQPLEVGQKALGDVGPDFIARTQGIVLERVHGETGTVTRHRGARIECPGQDGMEHAVIGAGVDHGFPVFVESVESRIGIVLVDEIIVVHRAAYWGGSGVDDIAQPPNFGIHRAVSHICGAFKP